MLWKIAPPGFGVNKLILSGLLFSDIFRIVSYLISILYMTGVAATQLWWYLSNMNVIQRICGYFHKTETFACVKTNKQSFITPTQVSLRTVIAVMIMMT